MHQMKACKKCRYLTKESRCPLCDGETSSNWQGYLVIINWKQSQIARKMGIEHDGAYALKVK